MKEASIKVNQSDNCFLYDEWLITNGLGGYACGSISGIPMRKYHGLLISSVSAPIGRALMLNFAEDLLLHPEKGEIPLTPIRTKQAMTPIVPEMEFKLESNFAVWHYHVEDIVLEKRIWMAHGQNTVYIRYFLISGPETITIKWRPYLHFRTTEQSVAANDAFTYNVRTIDGGYEIQQPDFPELHLLNDAHQPFTIDSKQLTDVYYEIEEKRGYECYGSLTSPGFFTLTLKHHEKTTCIVSTENLQILKAMSPEEALIAEGQRQKGILKAAKPLLYSKTLSKLVIAADQFLFTPMSREKDIVRLKAMGEDAQSIIAGYPWFTDWGRDTMISLEGLTLTTGRPHIALSILRTFAFYIQQGLIPNMFPNGRNEGLYHTADATLWFFHAVDRYVEMTKDEEFLGYMIPKFQQIIDFHVKGTLFGIKMDDDGLLSQGEKGYQLTWMDAKVNDWVVTPRRGKAVEINALWYNALKLMELWTGKTSEAAKKCYDAFNDQFWYEEGGYLYDVIDEENKKDLSLRPNQILSLSLRFPVLKNQYWKPVVDIVKKELLTNYGLRTLSKSHPNFKSYYDGDLLARDAAYHQGTVWVWLLGPFIDAWLKVYPDQKEEAKTFLQGIESHIDEQCIGSIAEIFDALDPYHARGCFAQAWSVAEYLRAYVKVHTEFQSH